MSTPNKYKPRRNTPKAERNLTDESSGEIAMMTKFKLWSTNNPEKLKTGFGHKLRGRKKRK